jgi:hypothetical protein
LDYWTNLENFLDVLIDHATHYLKFRESLAGSVLSLDAEKVSHFVFDPEGYVCIPSYLSNLRRVLICFCSAKKAQAQKKELISQTSRGSKKDPKTKDKHKSGPTGGLLSPQCLSDRNLATPPKDVDPLQKSFKRSVNNREFRAKNKPRLVCQR